MRIWNDSGTPHPLRPRTAAEIAEFFTGLDLVEPGVVTCSRWQAGTTAWAPRPR